MNFLRSLLTLLIGILIGYSASKTITPSLDFTEVDNKTQNTYNEGDEGFDAKAMTLQSYTADTFDYATIKNNTDKVIKEYTYRIIFYDMKGNMLDYKDNIIKKEIEPQMSRTDSYVEYESSDYAYYKTSDDYDKTHKKIYTIKYELKSYTFK